MFEYLLMLATHTSSRRLVRFAASMAALYCAALTILALPLLRAPRVAIWTVFLSNQATRESIVAVGRACATALRQP